ncbi:MAG: hypothetical protein A2698_00590 [Candidatus Levybacteria bacterium RIFCSPHIGHO2_01_FULL_42_15]|nr:MAG: hypothetical protein A2698_00590 [Candidatus Levybacteria bacterium RIFCSPHIGHO2_01_FULL_42_15]OGH43104.1 MAG: hypothetical protein A3B53_01385 [Candidatus Levybacteria bacterium RIFCSPLOWO2_01_FULL_42_15]
MRNYMNKIVSTKKAIEIAGQLKRHNKKIVLVGGCFDILHIGHIKFLQGAKQQADMVMILLENDESIRKRKGEGRPINSQKERAEILAALSSTNYIVLLPHLKTDGEYDMLTQSIKPDIIATTKNDEHRRHKDRQAKLFGIPVIEVVDRVKEHSSTQTIEMLIGKKK